MDGLEIDMLAVGDADCILITGWHEGQPTHVLVDAGRASNWPDVKKFLDAREVKVIHHLVSSHLDSDHAGGLIKLVKSGEVEIQKAWMHIPSKHRIADALSESLRKQATSTDQTVVSHVHRITASLNHSNDLLAALHDRAIPIKEPFSGTNVGFLEVCGPSLEYYEELLGSFRNIETITLLAEVGDLIEKVATRKDGLKNSPTTSPENNSSCILFLERNSDSFLFTADAGAEALELAIKQRNLAMLDWMQIPHHGSVNNITLDLIKQFSPERAYVSAAGRGHPHKAVIDAYKAQGATVYGTSRQTNLKFSSGKTPARPGYSPATPL